ncbi:hypothetical protein NIES37_58600 [Tolypothrix tenuis PCC 7101]|uniref:Uncharacterized protein n=1 Tax=Tolypothrix tenuis PCC 7101 TaxID=231146 RepID=A0A1Z4N7Z8_9CYAN|nr:hypothetical protein [Aulosira sp. FACHB-113]BAZ01853.1 hypothetical protein NIES37_58600 [Tolypothrix tenuis PCC 7101]BAZ74222.1 hypothetical protein NIES50_27930 [Aulosira laxa NIES-50]
MRSVFTIAIGSKSYLDYAFTLARSFIQHHQDSSIKFFIITDLKCEKPRGLESIEIVKIDKNSIAEGISSKLYLDKLAPTAQSIFIDSDCLCFRNLEPIFEKFAGNTVSVVGFPIFCGEWCGALAEDICKKFNINHIPRFNGGIYYIEPGEKATIIYNTARSLEPYYDQLGFSRHRGWCNEEPLLSIAIATNGGQCILDDGNILSDLASCPETAKLNVVVGQSKLYNPPQPHIRNKWWYDFSEYSPAVIHFSGGASTTYPYVKEKFRLLLVNKFTFAEWFADILCICLFSLPFQLNKVIKQILRPVYRFLFGIRKISNLGRTFKSLET